MALSAACLEQVFYGSLRAHGTPFFTEPLGVLPYLPSLKTIQITSKTATPHSLTPPPLLLFFGSGRFEELSTSLCHYYQVFILAMYSNRQTSSSGWIPCIPQKPFNLWMSTGNPSLWIKQINSRLTEIYKITRVSESYPSATYCPQFSHVVYPTCCLSTATRAKANF